MTRTGDREIGVVSGRLPDNTGELACMLCDETGLRKARKQQCPQVMLWFFVRKIIVTDKNCCDVFICLQDQNDRNAIIKSCAPKTKIHAKKVQNMSKRGIAGFITIPLYCTFHKHANSKVEKRFSLPSIILMITRKEP